MRLLVGERLARAGEGSPAMACDGWRRENTAGLKTLAVRNAKRGLDERSRAVEKQLAEQSRNRQRR